MNGPQESNGYNAYGQGMPQGQGPFLPPAPPAFPGTPGGPVLPKRPKQVDSSFTMLMVVLALTVLAVPVNIAQLHSAENQAAMAVEAGNAGVGAALAVATVFLVVVGVVAIAITLVSAIFVRKGHHWARIMLTVYTGLSVLSLVAQFNLLGWWGILLLVLATVPLYLTPSPEYFTMMKQSRLQQKAAKPF